MATVTEIVDRIRGVDLEARLGLRAPAPPVVLSIAGDEMLLLRVKPARRGKPTLEALDRRELPAGTLPTSIFDAAPPDAERIASTLRDLLEKTGTRPGRTALILPDNLAKVTLFPLAERPASRRTLDELVRAKMRKSIPFRLDEASLSYEALPTDGEGVSLLTVVTRRAVVERLERAFESAGCRLGLIDLATPNLLNLVRPIVEAPENAGADVAVLHCAGSHFTLAILRRQRLIFVRSKPLAHEGPEGAPANAALLRELSSSFSYYQDKLEGRGLRMTLLSNVANDHDALAARLGQLGCGELQPIDPSVAIEVPPSVRLPGDVALRVAPAVGLVAGRG